MSNYATSTELRDIASIADEINELDERLRTRNVEVSFGDIPLFDVNGDAIGWLKYQEGLWAFTSKEIAGS